MAENKRILEEFIKKGGFDSLGVTAIRDLMFGYLMEEEEYRGLSDFELSVRLRVQKSKVSALRKMYAIRNHNEASLMERSRKLFFDEAPKINKGGHISVGVKDPLIKEYFENLLEKNDLYYDTSFRRGVLDMPPVSFLALANELAEEGKKVDAKVWRNAEIRSEEFQNFFKEAEPGLWENAMADLKSKPVTHIMSALNIPSSFINLFNFIKKG